MFVEFHQILQGKGLDPPDRAVLGCAGVIEDGGTRCSFTNLELKVSTAELGEIGLQVELINDFFANAQQIPFLEEADRTEIPHGQQPEEPGKGDCKTMVVLGPGSGLGVAPVFWDEKRQAHYSQPSEGGHKAFSPRNELEWALYKYLRREVADGRDPDVELVASGKGLTKIVSFLCYGDLPAETGTEKVKLLRKTEAFQTFVESLCDATPQVAGRKIIRAYQGKQHRAALKLAIRIFVDTVAAAARDAVHDFGAYGGVYLSGGNARRLKKNFLSGRFMEIFDESYEHRDKLRQTPVYLVTSRTLGIDGAARYAFSKKAESDAAAGDPKTP
jgi:glucokinase